MHLWGAGVGIAVLALFGYWAERARWGGNPEVHVLEVVFLFAVPVGAVVTVLGLILEVSGG